MHVVKQNYEQRVRVEEKEIGKKERVLMQMEMLEMKLIKNLQSTQNMQKDAYSELEKALMTQTNQEGGPLSQFDLNALGVPSENKKKKKRKKGGHSKSGK